MENLKIGTKVKLTKTAKNETYSDMSWKNLQMIITHRENDGEGMGYIYSFDALNSSEEITFRMYGYELELI